MSSQEEPAGFAPPAPISSVVASPPAEQRWQGAWLRCTLLGAAAVTVMDAVLLQQKKFFFTGGFLATTYTRTGADVAGFAIASLLADAAAIGLLAAIALWALQRVRLTPLAREIAVLVLAVTPLVVAEFLTYRLASYLGDAFDLSLLFDLTGRHPSEFLAVAARHLVRPALLLVVGGGAAVALVQTVNRVGRRSVRTRMRAPFRIVPLALLLFVAIGIETAVVCAASDTIEDGIHRKASGHLLGSLTAVLTDFDRDGFGMFGSFADPAPFNASIYPYAADVPGNGIDEDGVGGDLPATVAPYTEGPAVAPVWRSRPNVVLIVLESFRADAFGRVLNGKPVTPVLNALATQGVSVPLAFSHNGYTAQSRFHIFSGSLAGLRHHQTLVDDFKAHGYQVAYFSGQDDAFGGPEYSSGFERADVFFDARQDPADRYTTFTTAGSLAVPFDVVEARLSSFLAHRDRSRPLFLFVNFHDTHYPYHRKGLRPLVSKTVLPEAKIDPSRAAAVRDMYFNTAANVDAAIGATLDDVRQHVDAPPAVIVLADHGESLFDQGFLGHGYALNDIQTRIPLIVAGLPAVIQEPFGQSDLRDIIGAALARGPDAGTTPRVMPPSGKQVFQYLGVIDRPRQIAFNDGHVRTIYDFRSGRVDAGDGRWVEPKQLTGEAAARFTSLIQLWERMILARRNVPAAP